METHTQYNIARYVLYATSLTTTFTRPLSGSRAPAAAFPPATVGVAGNVTFVDAVTSKSCSPEDVTLCDVALAHSATGSSSMLSSSSESSKSMSMPEVESDISPAPVMDTPSAKPELNTG